MEVEMLAGHEGALRDGWLKVCAERAGVRCDARDGGLGKWRSESAIEAATAILMGCQPATYATGMSIHATASSCSSASLPAGSGSMCFHLVMRNSSFLSASLLSV